MRALILALSGLLSARAQGTDGFGQAGFYEARAFRGHVADIGGGGGGDQDQDEGDQREAEAGKGSRDQHLIHRNRVQAEDVEGYVLQDFDALQDGQGEEKGDHGERGEDGQGGVQSAMKFLPCPAVGAFVEVLFVIPAHLRRNCGDVVAPATQNGSNYPVCALGSCHSV